MGNNPRIEEPYDLRPSHTVLLGVDFQLGFCEGGWEDTPGATAAVENFRVAARAWRAAGGHVVLCREIYYPSDYVGADGTPIQAIVDNHPLMDGREQSQFYPDLVHEGDIVMRKKGFSAVQAGNLLEILAEHGWDTVVMGGLTTPICVGITADDLSMAGIKVVVLSDACASQSFDGVAAADAHRVTLARLRYQFTQTMTSAQFGDIAASFAANRA